MTNPIAHGREATLSTSPLTTKGQSLHESVAVVLALLPPDMPVSEATQLKAMLLGGVEKRAASAAGAGRGRNHRSGPLLVKATQRSSSTSPFTP